ncbi:hypothetical protein AB0C52_23740 [Streptomyces sp. NPDC048717]|uniref:hypothetical protein n=1 Tax=Streptomyces sp. NPDC048717 TaxID=3154928 RepID=UPI00342A591B
MDDHTTPRTRWTEDTSLEAPDGHRWMKAAPDDCPSCPCHTERVCTGKLWSMATRPETTDGTPHQEPCPCEAEDQDAAIRRDDHIEFPYEATLQASRDILRDAIKEAFPGPAPDCCKHVTCDGDGPCGYVIIGTIAGSILCECTGQAAG